MIKQQHCLARLIAPLFLLQALILQAQTPTISSSTSSLPTSSCNTLTGQTTGVEQRLRQYRELINGRQCVVLNANPSTDLGELVKQIPENTVIFLSSNTAPGATLSPATPASSITPGATLSPTTPASYKTSVEYLVDSEIVLKNGQDIIGAADDGFEIVIRDRSDFIHRHLLRVGYPGSFKPEETKDSHIRHLTFSPSLNNARLPIDSIIFAECYNRKLIVEDNVFRTPVKAALALDCKEFSDASDPTRHLGPGLLFTNNKIYGGKYTSIMNKMYSYFIQEQGIFINISSVINQSDRLSVIGNLFEDDIAEAAEFRLAPGSKINVFNNIVNINNFGPTTRSSARKGGFILVGPTYSLSKRPVFFLAGNQIKVTRTAITVSGQLGLTLACNHLQAVNPWRQPLKQFSIKAMPAPLRKVSGVCSSFVGPTTVMPTAGPNSNFVMSTFTPDSMAVMSTSGPDSTVVMSASTPNATLAMSTPTPNSTVVMSTPAVNSTVAIPTPTTHGSIRFANIWTPIKDSSSTACAGLVNFEGQFFFYSEICQPFTLASAFASASVANTTSGSLLVPTTAAGSTAEISGLGVLATLAIWLNL
ncbi:hypothetical protein [Endozoicomonas sp. 8E]|uniref:hypothetical protein n=1 Tax=Endozoicomonas sp. 8E TaxID=3035692 RepID=UPI0029394881|nr:hypothetical protein [Endozoicomonas sp. 8E]WOG30078.1 hypothetical protein P6910_10605 [Endozoicomonas sp. 8E]